MNPFLRSLLNLPPQRSSIARSIDTLHYAVILTAIGGAVIAAAFGLWFLVRYHRKGTTTPVTQYIVAPLWLEVVVIAGLLTLFCGFWVVGFTQYRRMQSPPSTALPIYVSAKQWMWEFAYPDGPTSNSVLVVPVGYPIKLIMTSRDVIHSFYVPDYRIKQDVVPGRTVTTWFEVVVPGVSDVLCAEYCGTRHSMMRAHVVALSAADYAQWRARVRAPLELAGSKGEGVGLAARGKASAAEHGCLRCHSFDGTPFIGPTWARAFGAQRQTADGRSIRIDEAYLTESMMDPGAVIAAGFQPVMPSYRGLLEPQEVAAILEYIRSLRDVPTQVVEPAPAAAIAFPQDVP